MNDFQTILLEGICYLGDKAYPDSKGRTEPGFFDLLVQSSGGAVSVYDTLRPLVGRQVQLAVHHVPSMPIDVHRWGGGACHWEPYGRCPFGHHTTPTRMFNEAGSGVLAYDLDHETSTGGWWLEQFDGTRLMLPLAHALPGHRSRVAAATLFAVDAMRDALAGQGLDSVESLGNRATDLRDMLEQARRMVREDT